MKIKQTVKQFVVGLTLILGIITFSLVSSAPSFAADCKDATTQTCCGGLQTSIIACPQTGSDTNVQDTGLWGVLIIVINILSAGIGVVALAGIVYASILYTSAGGNAEQTKKAMGIIGNIVIGVIAFGLMFTVLNFLVPGGLFN